MVLFVRLLVVVSAVIVLSTEFLSAAGFLGRVSLAILWITITLLAIRRLVRTFSIPHPSWFEGFFLTGIGLIAVGAGLTAIVSPPNSVDAFGYHLSRVVWWAQQGSVRFFPTPYYPQVSMPPMAEYAMLHTWLLSSGDRFVNLVQWTGFIGSIAAVWLLARELGAGSRGQMIAAVFCATLPNGILQASGAKNECVLAFFLAAMAYFALRWVAAPNRIAALWVGMALGLALATKSTAFLFAPPLLAACLWKHRGVCVQAAGIVTICVLTLNGPQWWRNTAAFGSPLGPPKAQATQGPEYRWTNGRFGWRTTASNALRHASQQLGGRSEAWNRAVYEAVLAGHRAIGADPNDPASTWPDTRFAAPVNANHEADAPNRVQLVVLLLCMVIAAWKRPILLNWAAVLTGAFLVVCVVLKYQPFFGRVFLPLFVLGSPLVGVVAEWIRPPVLQALLCLMLFDQARNPVLRNWTRPLLGPGSILHTRRDSNYFRDMGQFGLGEAEYRRAAELAAEGGCRRVALDNSRFHLEYPLQLFLLQRDPEIRFVRPGLDVGACAVVTLGHPIQVQRRGGRITAATTAPAPAIPANVK